MVFIGELGVSNARFPFWPGKTTERTYGDLGRRVQRQRLLGCISRCTSGDNYTPGHAVLFHAVPRQLHHVDHAAEIDVHDRVAGLKQPIILVELVRECVGHF